MVIASGPYYPLQDEKSSKMRLIQGFRLFMKNYPGRYWKVSMIEKTINPF